MFFFSEKPMILSGNMERRNFSDRRKKPTPLFSRYTLWGRRKGFRRKQDQERGGYVDRYGARLLFFIILIVGLNVLDCCFTIMILDCGGVEANPIVSSAIEVYGNEFWVWKFITVSGILILLCLHSRFRYVTRAIWSITLLFLGVILYQVFLLRYHIF